MDKEKDRRKKEINVCECVRAQMGEGPVSSECSVLSFNASHFLICQLAGQRSKERWPCFINAALSEPCPDPVWGQPNWHCDMFLYNSEGSSISYTTDHHLSGEADDLLKLLPQAAEHEHTLRLISVLGDSLSTYALRTEKKSILCL